MNDSRRSSPDLLPFLRDVPLFAGLTDQALASLAQACRIRQVPKGKTLFNQMDPAEAFYVVRSGRIAILLDSADGRELVINEMRAGDCFGELALLTGQPRSTSAMAREASEVIAISRETFLAEIETEPKLLRHVLESTARRLSASSERESALAFLDAPARLARVLLEMDRQASADGFITVSQEELAQRVGLTRQTAAKTLGRWRRAGWIITGRGKIVLLNRAGLRRQTEESGS